MEKIIFFTLVIPILAFVIYLGVSAIMKGFSAKSSNKDDYDLESDSNSDEYIKNDTDLGDELKKLNDLFKSGALTEEEFEKAKKKILEN